MDLAWVSAETNVAGSMADPLWAGSPLISLTSSIGMPSRDRYEYQELDRLKMHTAVAGWNKTISVPERAAAMVRAAICVATGPAPAPAIWKSRQKCSAL